MARFLVDRFAERLRIFAEDYLADAVPHASWAGSLADAATTLVNEAEALGLMAALWQGLRDELVGDQPAFAADIDRFETDWRDETELLWEAILAAATSASDEVVADLDHDPEVYVARSEADAVITEFLGAAHPAVILTGAAGVGKTSFAVELRRRLVETGDGVLLMAGKWMSADPVWEQVASKLGLGEQRPVELLAERAKAGGGRMVVIIDGLHEVPGTEGGVSVFKSLNSALADLPEQVRVLVTVTLPAWRRLERRVREDIRRGRYFAPGGDLSLELHPLNDDELADAWARYQARYDVATDFAAIPSSLRRQLRNPAMMHLLALAFEGGEIPEAELVSASDFFKRYFDFKVRLDDERVIVDGIAAAMYQEGKTPLSRALITEAEPLRSLIIEADDSAYARLVDKDVIREFEEKRSLRDARFIEYSIQRFGAWVLASYLAERTTEPERQVELIVEASAKFATYPPAWDAATMLLVQAADDEVFLRLAGSDRSEVRELVVEAIAQLALVEPERVTRIIDGMLATGDDRASTSHGTALRASYRVSIADPKIAFDDAYLAIARGADDELRQSLHDTLYLIWRNDPDYTIGVLGTLIAQLDRGKVMRRFWEVPETRRLLELVAQIAITLYTTNPTVELGKAIGELGHELIVRRLKVVGLMSNSLVQGVLFPVVDRRFSEHIYRGFLVDSPDAVERVFQLDGQAKDDFRVGIRLLDPAQSVVTESDALRRLLGADGSDVSSLLAAQALAVHLVTEFETTRQLVETLHGEGDLRTRFWILTAFLVLLESTPPEWVPFLEDLTTATIDGHAGVLGGEEGMLDGGRIDQVLMPLGLAYGKRGIDMPIFLDVVTRAVAEGDLATAARCVGSLGSIGFHHPKVARDTLWRIWDEVLEEGGRAPDVLVDATVDALAAIRVLYPGIVDDLLADLGHENLATGVRTSSEPGWLRAQVALLGLYNNGVHLAVCNPIMREGLLVPIYEALVDGENLGQAVKGLTGQAWKLVEEHEYHLDRWMGPATGGVCC